MLPPLSLVANATALLAAAMSSPPSRFTPDVMIQAPRRSYGIPKPDGSLVLYTVGAYSLESHQASSQLFVLDTRTKKSHLVISDFSNSSSPHWLGDGNNIIILSKGEKGSRNVVIGDVFDFQSTSIGTIPGPVGCIRVNKLSDNKFILGYTGQAAPDGSLVNPETAQPPKSQGRLYKSLFVRHWDTYLNKNRNSIWYSIISKNSPAAQSAPAVEPGQASSITINDAGLNNTQPDSRIVSNIYPGNGNSNNNGNGIRTATGKEEEDSENTANNIKSSDPAASYSLSPPVNVLKNTHLESPIKPFGCEDDYNLDGNHLLFIAKDPSMDPAVWTKSNLYVATISETEVSSIVRVEVDGVSGASSSPRLSRDGKRAAFLQMRENGYEADKHRLFLIPDISKPTQVLSPYGGGQGSGLWDLSPSKLEFSADGNTLYMIADNRGRYNLFETPFDQPDDAPILPKQLTYNNSVTRVSPLEGGGLFLSGSSIIDSSIYWTLEPGAEEISLLDSHSYHGSLVGLRADQISEVYYNGAKTKVHAWVVKPSDFDPEKRYPLAFLIHGGPQGSWTDTWSSRWNPAVFAEQGYVVFAPNPTGSTGFGQNFTDAIQGQWGGLPYQDLVMGFNYVEANMPYVDIDRAVALGASYGGYMINWIQGNELGRRFKALMCHDGVFSMSGQMSSEEQWFINHELQGTFWKNRRGWAKWDPAELSANWATPQLTVHSERDYRLTVAEGLAAFTVLQQKGIESQFLHFPDENHWVSRPENAIFWHASIMNWINRFVGLPEYRSEAETNGEIVERQWDPSWTI